MNTAWSFLDTWSLCDMETKGTP